MTDMSMVYCWLNLQHQQKQSQVLRHLYLHSPICFWLLFWLLWPLFHKPHQNVVLLEDWMTIELPCLLLSAWSSLGPIDSPSLSILYQLKQNYLHCLRALLQEYLFDLPFSKMHLKVSQYPSWIISPNVLLWYSDKWISISIVLLFLYFSPVM